MAVVTGFVDGQYVSWGNIVNGLTNKTVISWINPTSFTAGFFHGITGKRNTTDPGFSIGIDPATGYLWAHDSFSTGSGNWRTSTAISTSAYSMQAVTYTSTTTPPIFYHNGSSVAVTTISTPSGVLVSDATKPLVVGDYGGAAIGTKSLNGQILSVLWYNRILTAAEIADAYASRMYIPTYIGLVFAAKLIGAAGLQTFGGTTLSSSNQIVDPISGALGTPTGSPVGREDNYLYYGN